MNTVKVVAKLSFEIAAPDLDILIENVFRAIKRAEAEGALTHNADPDTTFLGFTLITETK